MKKRKGLKRFWQALPAGSLAALLAALPLQGARATDGVIQINQARALAGGVTAGDTPGFPVTITEGGRYILTSNLDVTGQPNPESVTAIEVVGTGGSINMNGFGIIGPTVCSGQPVTSCTPTGTGVGIRVVGGTVVSIVDGSISGMGYRGIDMSTSWMGVVRRVGVYGSGAEGIVLPGISFAEEVSVNMNGGSGIVLGARGSVKVSHTLYNGANGIEVGYSSRVRESMSSVNGGDGIVTSVDSVVVGNTATSNTGYGLNLGSGTGYQGNVVNLNTGGTVTGTSLVEMGVNVCGGNATCP